MSVTVYAGNVEYGTEWVKDKPPYKHWDDLSNLKSNTNRAFCVKNGSVATRSGTYNTPAPIVLNQFNINLIAGTKIKKVVVHYSQQKFSLSRSQGSSTFPVFGGATFTLLGTGLSKTGEAVSSTYKAYTIEFTGVTREQLMSNSFGLKIAYPRNNSTNTGNMCIGNVCIEIVTEEPKILVSMDTSNNNKVLHDTVEVNCNVERLGSTDYKPVVFINVPVGLSLQTYEGIGSVTSESNGVYRWSSDFDGRNKNTVKITFECIGTGEQKISIVDSLTSAENILRINVKEYTYTVSTSLYEKNKPYMSGSTVDYNITVKTDNPTNMTLPVSVVIPSGVTINNLNVLQSSYGLTGNTVDSNNMRTLLFNLPILKTKTIPFNVTLSVSVYSVQNIFIDTKLYVTTPFIVIPSSYESLGFTRLEIPDAYKSNMGNNIDYIFSTIAKYELDNTNANIINYKNNLRIGIYNDSIDYVTDEDDFLNHVIWCQSISTKKWEEYKCQFKYNKNNPLYLVYSHDYVGNPLYESIHLDFSQGVLIEKQYDGLYDVSKKYPVPVTALLNNTEFAKVNMDKRTSTAPVIVYEWSGVDVFKTEDISLRGIVFNMTYNTSNDIEIQVTVSADGHNNIKGYRNKTLKKGSGTITLGGRFDLFGLTPHDLRGKVDQLTIEVEVNNPYDTQCTVELNDVKLTVNYIVIRPEAYGFEINGERSEEYGIYFTDMTPNLGTKNEISDYSITGSDKSIVNRMNINPKEIEIELSIDECDLEEELAIADDVITKLFTNKRNVLTNKPTMKYIIFDNMPDKRYWFVRKDEIDDSIDDGSYNAKIKLYIPDGTAEVIPMVTTGSAGATNGLISIEPLIHLQCTTKGKVQLSETYTKQSLLVTSSSINTGDIITVDNEQRKVTVKTPGGVEEKDITSGVDFSTTWFKLRGEYNFTSSTSIITDVQFYDRR